MRCKNSFGVWGLLFLFLAGCESVSTDPFLLQIDAVHQAVVNARDEQNRTAVFHIPGLSLATPLSSVEASKRGVEPFDHLQLWGRAMAAVPQELLPLISRLEHYPETRDDSEVSEKLSVLAGELRDLVNSVFDIHMRLLIPSRYLDAAGPSMLEVVQSASDLYVLYNKHFSFEPSLPTKFGVIFFDFHLIEDDEWHPAGEGGLRASASRVNQFVSGEIGGLRLNSEF